MACLFKVYQVIHFGNFLSAIVCAHMFNAFGCLALYARVDKAHSDGSEQWVWK
jgi:hypothetical protein